MSKLLPCIYCNKRYDFTDEHVFPAGLGGDDKNYLLIDMVCGNCNTKVFSKFEDTLMRSSPIALARLFLQKHGRGRGAKASLANITTRMTTLFDEECGEIEAEVIAGGELIPLMQLVFLGAGKVYLSGQSEKQNAFLNTLRLTLSEQISIVRKGKGTNQVNFQTSNLIWDNGAYTIVSQHNAEGPPKNCIWLEPLDYENVVNDRKPRLYQRTKGQIVLRLQSDSCAPELLTIARAATEKLMNQTPGPDKTIVHPLVKLSMSMNIDDVYRALAKIGVNLIAHLYGDEYVRHFAFNGIKQAILTGKPKVRLALAPNPFEAFEGVPHEKHVMTLAFIKSRAGRYCVGLLIRLYGASTYIINLSSNAILPFDDGISSLLHSAAVFVVDYKAQKIEQYTLQGFLERYPPKVNLNDFDLRRAVADSLLEDKQQRKKIKKAVKLNAY